MLSPAIPPVFTPQGAEAIKMYGRESENYKYLLQKVNERKIYLGLTNVFAVLLKKQEMKPRVLHLSSAKTWRGGEQQLAYLVEILQKKRVSQWVFCVKNSALANYCLNHQLPFTTYQKFFAANPFIALDIIQFCKKNAVNILHAHDSHSLTYACLAAQFSQLNIKIVISRRVDFPIRSQWKYNHPAVQKILCVSNFVKQIIEKDIKRKSVLSVVYDGINVEKFSPPSNHKNKLRKAFNIPLHVPIIGNIAAIAPHKDYQTFVHTVEILVRREIKAKFFIIGADGGEQNKIEQLIQQKDLQNHIILTGFRKDIRTIFPELDILLFTSKTEGLGTTILDAFAAQVPVVATAAGGIPEIVVSEITGLLAPVGDAETLALQVIRLLMEEQLKFKLIQNAKNHITQFTKEKMANETFKYYQDS